MPIVTVSNTIAIAKNQHSLAFREPFQRPDGDEVLLKQVVRDRRLGFYAGEQRIERRRHNLACSKSCRPDEHDLVAQRFGRHCAAQSVRRRHIGKRSLPTPQVFVRENLQ